MRDGRERREERDSARTDASLRNQLSHISRLSRLSRASRDLQLTARTQTYISIDRFLTVMGFTGTACGLYPG